MSPIPLGLSEFDETCRFGKRRSKATTGRIFKLIKAKIYFRFTSSGRSDNRIVSKSRFSKVHFLNFAYLLSIKSIWGNSKSGKKGNKRSII